MILDLWKVKTGKRPPDDLSDEFRVELGTFTEPFNRAWFTKKTGLPVIVGDPVVCRTKGLEFMRANLDGEVSMPNGESAVFEAKHTGGHVSMKEALATYQPQLHHNMIVTGLKRAFLSVILGNEWDYIEVDLNEEYAARLIEVEQEFWECVRLKMPPSEEPQTIDPPEATKVVDMTGSNEWAALAHDWLTNGKAAKLFESSADGLKKLVASDTKVARGHGIEITRDKRRYLKIKEMKDG